MIISDHAEMRQKQRNISQEAIDYIVDNGQAQRKRDAVYYTLSRRHLETLPSNHPAHHYYGIRVVVSRCDNVIITVCWDHKCPPRYQMPQPRPRKYALRYEDAS